MPLNNAILVVVGDVDPQQVLTLAQKHFGPLPPSELQPPRPVVEVAQRGERRVVVKAPATLPYLIMGYKVPVLRNAEQDWEAYALEVLAGVLDQGASARLSRHLIRGQQIASSAGAGYDLVARLQGLFTLAANPAPDHKIDELEQALREQVRQLQEQLVNHQELDRVVAQIIASEIYQRDSTFYQGMRLGILETNGLGFKTLDNYVERIKAVTPEQIRQVARQYLTDDRLTVAILDPLPLDEKQPLPVSGHSTQLH